MHNGFVPWSETKDPLACNTDDPVNFIEVSRDPVRTPFQWNNGKNGGMYSIIRKSQNVNVSIFILFITNPLSCPLYQTGYFAKSL